MSTANILDRYPILRAIPDGAIVTLHLRTGRSVTGTEATRDDDMRHGLVRLEVTGNRETNAYYVHASDIVMVQIEYEE